MITPAIPEPTAAELDAIDPRFWEAVQDLQQVVAAEGMDKAMQNPAHAPLFVQMMRFAPAHLVQLLRLQIAAPVGPMH